ncbi:TIGR04211 family SH3 domain-containing protein [Shewanella sp. AS16]|uniref:TIGR04211 family SH3 domain-containing protein n=1 Tax=Shewanella sp. AS16 TaxID=2907625 RepID=UPI001F42B757|nr:TIGR04211 family SH3 domain-containing protein [Shewanella sp. AS16]MCE9685589.1 TIGR04211 family SH3 domain-containing protein [Shewanella sp. AS16]
MLRLLTLAAILLLSPSLLAAGQTRYISDNVFLYLLGGPGTQYRILGSVEAGQPVTFTGETQAEYSKIVDHKGREGWVQTDMLSAEQSFRERLPQVEAKLEQTQQQLNSLRNSSDGAMQELASLKSQLNKTQRSLEQASQERDQATDKLANIARNERFNMWSQGVMIAGIGMIIGIFLVYLPRPQRRKKDRWM